MPELVLLCLHNAILHGSLLILIHCNGLTAVVLKKLLLLLSLCNDTCR